jgi:hypothetical protein
VVHYRGAAPALTDVIAGHINAVIMGPSVALTTVKAGKLKMLAFASAKRLPQFPDVPTMAVRTPSEPQSGEATERPAMPKRRNGDAPYAAQNGPGGCG